MTKTIKYACQLLLILLAASPASAQKTIKFSCASDPHQRDYKFAQQQFDTIFASLGINFEMEHVPKDEISATMFEGRFDGDCGRVPTFITDNNIKNTSYIKAPFRTAIFAIWRLKSDRVIRNNSELKVQVISQISSIDSYLEKMGFQMTQERDSFANLVKKLRAGSIDRILVYQAALNETELRDAYKDITLDREIIALPVKALIHNRHAELAEKIAQALATMNKTQNTNEQLLEKTVASSSFKRSLTFSCTIPPSRKEYRQVKQILSRALSSINYGYIQRDVNLVEETNLLKRGLVDGSCARSITNDEDTLYKAMNSPIARATLKLWSHKAQASINSLSDLAPNSGVVTVGKPKYITRLLTPLNLPVTSVETPTQAFRFVSGKRADYYVSFSTAPAEQLHTMKITEPLFWVGTIDYGNVYPHLLKKHQHIEEPLNRALTKQKAGFSTLIEQWEANTKHAASSQR